MRIFVLSVVYIYKVLMGYQIKNDGDMAKLVDVKDLIGLSFGMKSYQMIIFKFRETLEFTMDNLY